MALKISSTRDYVLFCTWGLHSTFSSFFVFRSLELASVMLELSPDSSDVVAERLLIMSFNEG